MAILIGALSAVVTIHVVTVAVLIHHLRRAQVQLAHLRERHQWALRFCAELQSTLKRGPVDLRGTLPVQQFARKGIVYSFPLN